MINAFYDSFKKDDAILTLNGKQIARKDCVLLGFGAEKRVFGIAGSEECFFLPNRADAYWDSIIKSEKAVCDHILSVGLRAQLYEIVPLTVQASPEGQKYTLNVLLTKTFESLAKKENISIHHVKSMRSHQRLIGKNFDFYDGKKENLADPQWNRQLLASILKEYAVALTFNLPINVVAINDDSEHLYFEHPPEQKGPPVVHYFFWDVASDFNDPVVPTVPDMEALRAGTLPMAHKDDPNPIGNILYGKDKGLKGLCNKIASVFSESNNEYQTMGFENLLVGSKACEEALFASITEEMLIEALAEARKQAQSKLKELLPKLIEELKSKNEKEIYPAIVEIFKSAISTTDLDLVKESFKFLSNVEEFAQKHGEELRAFAQLYPHPHIHTYLAEHLKIKAQPTPHVPVRPIPVDAIPRPQPRPPVDAPQPLPIHVDALPRPQPALAAADLPAKGIVDKGKDILFTILNKPLWRGLMVASLVGLSSWFFLGCSPLMAAWTAAGGFGAMVGIPYWRAKYAQKLFDNAVAQGDIRRERKPLNEYKYVVQANLDEIHFKQGAKAEKSWGGYLSACLDVRTYLPFSQASNSFQVGRAAAAERAKVKARLKSVSFKS